MHARAAAQVPTHELAQVGRAGALVEPVGQPARLVRDQHRLVAGAHALVRHPRKVPAVRRNSQAWLQPPCTRGLTPTNP